MTPEMLILADLSDLHQAMYNKMASISGIAGLQFIGFGSSRQKPVLPEIGMHISVYDMEVDRNRPTPLEGTPVSLPNGDAQNLLIGGVQYNGVFLERKKKYPLPLTVTYKIDTWCHDVKTALLMDQKIFSTFPERGGLTFNIQNQDTFFPMYLLNSTNLDEPKEHIRERIYIFVVETWIDGTLADKITKVITKTNDQIFKGTQTSDADVPGNNLMDVTLG